MERRGLVFRVVRCGLPALLLGLAAAGAVVQQAAGAASLVVNSLADSNLDYDGVCTLREAITAANNNANYHECASSNFGDDTITFAASYTIVLGSTLPPVMNAGSLTIDGSGRTVNLSGADSHRILFVNAGAKVTIRDMIFSHGLADSSGGAIYNLGDLLATKTLFIANHTDASGGAIFNTETGNLAIINCSLLSNSADNNGGAVGSFGHLEISESTLEDNIASQGGGVTIGAEGTATIWSSVFIHNRAMDGAGLRANGASAAIFNSTFYNNDWLGGPAGDGAAIAANSALDIAHCTIAGNHVGIYSNDVVTVRNSIVAGNDLWSPEINCRFSEGELDDILNDGNNVDGGATCGWGTANGTLSGTDPLLDDLSDYGGPTLSMALLPGSPAIDGVVWNIPNRCPVYDQRGIVRPGARCDIGAYEVTGGFVSLIPLVFRT